MELIIRKENYWPYWNQPYWNGSLVVGPDMKGVSVPSQSFVNE